MTANTFFDEWSIYNHVLEHNYMLHEDIYGSVQHFFARRFFSRSFSLLDLGCGSALHLSRALEGRAVSRYVGYDLSDAALAQAVLNLTSLGCPVELRQGDLLAALSVGERFDVIFTSFALHHLASAQKLDFFRSARQVLSEDGTLLLIDTMRDEGENRDLYLDRYCSWLRSRCKTLPPEALNLLLAHIRSCDFPETTADIALMATNAGFNSPCEITRISWHYAGWFAKGTGHVIFGDG